MVQDLKDSVSRIALFLEKPLDADVIETIADRCLFKNMKKNNMSNYSMVPREFIDQTKSEFLRKGVFPWSNTITLPRPLFRNDQRRPNPVQLSRLTPRFEILFTLVVCAVAGIVGDWKNQLTEAEAERFDAVYRDKMKDVKYDFVWD